MTKDCEIPFIEALENLNSITDNCEMEGPVLFVDDSEDFREILKVCYGISKTERKVIFLEGGPQAKTFSESLDSKGKNVPGIIFIDVNMPIISGFELLKNIRSLGGNFEKSKIIMLSNSDSQKDKALAQNLGAAGYISKSPDVNTYVEFFKSL